MVLFSWNIIESILFSFIGEGIEQVYFPIIVPIGVIGNILSFLVRNTISLIAFPHNT